MNTSIYRYHYRGHLRAGYKQGEQNEAILNEALCQTIEHIKELIRRGEVMTAALYHYKNMLFLYYEAIGKEMEPEALVGDMTPCLELWPGEDEMRAWVYMYHIYYHAVPESVEDWRRPQKPELRRGRIAFLYKKNIFEYVYHHVAIVNEGLLQGDKYQSIGLHENILFSYFEEPKTFMNVKRDLTKESKAIVDWLDVIPEDHFVSKDDGGVGNFMFLPAYFALGEEEKMR